MTTHPPHNLTLTELCAYMLEHRDDEAVFQAYMDRLLHAESPEEAAQWYSIKDMTPEQFAQLLQHEQA